MSFRSCSSFLSCTTYLAWSCLSSHRLRILWFALHACLPVHAQNRPHRSSFSQFASTQLLVSDHSGPVPFLCFRRSAFSSSFVRLFLF
uniref:Secreted protein n=2 Tax=Nothobranchius furzeri TaxID=105023 RepID=A0A1A7Z833_NOTFU